VTESRWARWEEYVVYTFWVTKFQLKKLLVKPKCSERDNIKIDVRERHEI
jgi:hypothetical protein